MLEWAPDALAALAGQLSGLLDRVPDRVPAGLHLCYGDSGHRHMIEPESLATQVRLANAVAERAGRAPEWVSFTVPYHPDEQAAGTTDAQVALIDRYLPAGAGSWGICTECSMARAEREDVPRLIDLHREIRYDSVTRD